MRYLILVFLFLCGCVADEIGNCARACESEKTIMQYYNNGWCQCTDKK